jgi:flagellar hook protein FlgE
MLAGVASIRAQQTRMNVIGNNLANINTTAFKSGRVSFQDMLSNTVRGATRPSDRLGGLNPMQIGMGVMVSGTDTNHEQGSLQATNRSTDLAIQGNGVFAVSDGENLFYTRDGAFDLDSAGDLVHRATGMRLTGWTANPETGAINPGDPITSSSSLNIPIGLRTAVQQTTLMEWTGNLDSKAAVGTTASNKVFVYDTLGAAHHIDMSFTKTAENEWSWTASPVDGSATITGSGTLTFDPANGKLLTGGAANLTIDPNGGAPPFQIDLTLSRMTQLSSPNTPAAATQNGFPPGALTDFSITAEGTVIGIFSNGLTRNLAQIAVSIFPNAEGLERVGSNLFRETDNSGIPNIGVAKSGGRGQINAGYLEQSNVDIGQEFTDLIITQRGFQANTRVVTTVDEMLQDLINLKR